MEYKIASRTCFDEHQSTLQFHYYLTVDTISAKRFSCESYGVHISDNHGTETYVPCLTTSPTKIDELMTLLIEHLVGPAGLEDVICDWIQQQKSGAEPWFGTAG